MSSLASPPKAHSEREFNSAKFTFSPEFELLLACSAVARSAESTPDLRVRLGAGTDWQQVLRLSEHHGVTPLVHQALREVPDCVPPAVLDDLARRCEHNALRNLRFTAELSRILDCLEAHGIAAIPYKGPVLAEAVYGDLALREFSDLDVLVRPGDVLPAKDALRELGFVPGSQFTPAEERAHLESGNEFVFDGPAGRNLLEIQWAIVPRFYAVDLNLDRFFARASRAEVGGRTVRALSAEDLLLALCVHAAKHAWKRLCWLRDIAGVVQSQPLNWDVVLQRARGLGMARILGVSLALGGRLLGASMPDSLTDKWDNDSDVTKLCHQVARHMPNSEEYNAETFQYFRFMLRLRERVSDRARFLFRLASTPSVGEWSVVRLPARLFPLYRLVRMFRIVGRFLRVNTPP
jgi:Uncharacterised nucleotidyltransferase